MECLLLLWIQLEARVFLESVVVGRVLVKFYLLFFPLITKSTI